MVKTREKGKMKKVMVPIVLILLSLVLVASPMNARAAAPRHGPGLDIYFYETPDQAHAALLAGEIDFYQWSLTDEQIKDAELNPKIQLAGYAENGMFEIDINNNYTIADFPGVRSPTNHVLFRKALAYMINKDHIIADILGGRGQKIDAPVAAPQTGYVNETVIGYYTYNLTKAEELLDQVFPDTDGDGIRNYPVGWPGREDGPNLDPIKFCIRSDHGHRLTVGRELADTMEALGIPVNRIEASSDVLFPIVMDELNYHLYTGGWSLGRYPTYLYFLYHSDFWGTYNYVTGMNESNKPNYPDLDEALYKIYYAKTLEEFKAAVKKATGLFVIDYCVNIPLWSYVSFWGYSKYLVGIVNMDGYGLENTYTFLNAYKVDDPDTPEDESQEPIRMGTVHAPKDLNILYSQWYYDYAVLDRVFAGLMATEPYNLAADNPWVAQDWEMGTWVDPVDGKTKTKVTYWIRPDVIWHAPVTGEEVRPFTAHDVEFSIWYIYPFDDCWQFSMAMNVHHTVVVDDYTIEVYFNDESIWFLYAPTGPLLPKDEWLPLTCELRTATFYSDGTNCTANTEYAFTEDNVVQVVSATIDGTPLVEGVNFTIVGSGAPDYVHNIIRFLTDFPAGTVTIQYYTQTLDPHGYYLGTLDWSDIWYSIGPYIPIGVTPGVGGSASFIVNPSHFIGAPPLGEIDWKWTWTGTVKPRGGYFQVGLFDAVKLLKAYCSRGDGEIDPRWFPGADIDRTDLCHVGLFDAVNLLGNYGAKFGEVP